MSTSNFNINAYAPQPGLIQRAVKFEPIRLDAAMFFKVIGILILSVGAIWFFRNKMTWLFTKKVHYPDVQPIEGGGDVTAVFLVQVPTYIQQMKAAISGANTSWQTYNDGALCSMYQRLCDLKPNELITVINTYNKNSQIDFKSAISPLKSGCLFGTDYKQRLMMRFTQFKI